ALGSPAIEKALGSIAPAARVYLLGLLNVRLGEAAAAERSLAELEGPLAGEQDAAGLAGSLRALWPWQPWESHERVLLWPSPGDPVTSVVLLSAAGFAVVVLLTWWGWRRLADPTPDAEAG
ncbi:MAG: hypothetical protein KY453_06315, partial [Gemmatimonadetes bacterium]|nr:hypothetical protein [Gemmatimonadota bacterium]